LSIDFPSNSEAKRRNCREEDVKEKIAKAMNELKSRDFKSKESESLDFFRKVKEISRRSSKFRETSFLEFFAPCLS
jgi:hypothetical protein